MYNLTDKQYAQLWSEIHDIQPVSLSEVEGIEREYQEYLGRQLDMEGLTEGRIVHYVLPNGDHRPAIVVNVWRISDEYGRLQPPINGNCNLQVFTDSDQNGEYNDRMPPVMWATSITYSDKKEPNTWHWIEKA